MRTGAVSAAAMVRPEIRALEEYRLDRSSCAHKLDQNELPWDLPAGLKRELARRLEAARWSRYPDFHSDGLRRALASRWRWPAEGILTGNGSNELLQVAFAALAGPGREVVTVAPSFALYPTFAIACGARLREVESGRDLSLPWAELVAEVERDPRRPVLLCSPNNPTGAAASADRIAELLDRLEAPLLLDNAYGEFCRQDYRPLLDRYPHLLLFRTFSKAWSLAGLRLGYLLAAPELVAELVKVKLPYNLGLAAAAAGELVLSAGAALDRRVGTVVARRRSWTEMLRSFAFEVFESEANFVLVRCGSGVEAHRIQDGLEARGIRVRLLGGHPSLSGCLRFSVGDGRSLRATRSALAELLR